MKAAKTALVTLAAAASLAQAIAADVEKEELAAVHKLKSEISLLNLLNGLYLSTDQLDKLIALGERAVQLRKEYTAGVSKQVADYEKALDALRANLYTPTGAPQEVKDRAVALEHKVELDPLAAYLEEAGRLEDEARKVLSEGQVAIIEEFKPCLIPPKNLADPVAVGQASTTEREEQMLDIIYRMPESLYRERRDRIASTIVGRGEREKGRIPEEVRSSMVKTYTAKLDEIRRMTDVDFALKKKDLAKDFQLFDDTVAYHKGVWREPGAISRYFFTDDAVETMKKWREARKNDPSQTELDAAAASDKGDLKSRIQTRVLQGYEFQARMLIRERLKDKKLTDAQGRQLEKTLADARAAQDAEKRFALIDDVVDKLNALSVTKTSAEAMLSKIAGLCFIKRVPGVMVPPALKGRGVEDITGLGAMVEQAREDLEAGNTARAYGTLTKVAGYLKQFKD
jgi:hypothetical protein